MIDPLRGVLRVQRIPVRSFIGVNGRIRGNNAHNECEPVRLGLGDGGNGATAALAVDDDDAALAALVFCKAAINAVFFEIGGDGARP